MKKHLLFATIAAGFAVDLIGLINAAQHHLCPDAR